MSPSGLLRGPPWLPSGAGDCASTEADAVSSQGWGGGHEVPHSLLISGDLQVVAWVVPLKVQDGAEDTPLTPSGGGTSAVVGGSSEAVVMASHLLPG